MKPYSLTPPKFKISKGWLLALVLLVTFFSLMAISYAQSNLPVDAFDPVGGLPRFPETGQGGEELAIAFIKNAIVIVRYLVGALALVLGATYAIQLVFSNGKEDVIEKQKTNFLWAFVGFIVLIIAENVASIFNPETATTTQLIDFNAARDQLRDIVDYMKWIIGSIIVLFMTVTGVRMVLSADEEEELTKQKQSLVWGLIGILVILLASNVVNAIYVIKAPDSVVAAGPESLITQIAGVVRLILVFLGPIAIAFTLYAGIFYLTAMHKDDQATKGKQMIIGGITGVVIIYAAFALVSTISNQSLADVFSLMA